jgi:hypothetical protein
MFLNDNQKPCHNSVIFLSETGGGSREVGWLLVSEKYVAFMLIPDVLKA